MARRPIFMACKSGTSYVRTHDVEFQWFSGMAVSQARKSITSLHAAAEKQLDEAAILEISSKSAQDLGIRLSAFNLMIRTVKHERQFSVESAYQASKVFERGGPFTDILCKTSLEAKRDSRLKEHGRLVKYCFFGTVAPFATEGVLQLVVYKRASQTSRSCERSSTLPRVL